MILMGGFYRCDSWSKVLRACENQVSWFQSQPGHSKIITQILKNNEIGLAIKMGLDIKGFICLTVFLPFASSSLLFFLFFFPLSSSASRIRNCLLNENRESSHKSSDFWSYDFRKNIPPHQIDGP